MSDNNNGLWEDVMKTGKGREHGLTNCLYGNEIADIMERFDSAIFQIQVWRDLAKARYKLYDATGMWVKSRSYFGAATSNQITLAGRAYIDKTLCPPYFERLEKGPNGKAPDLKVKTANYVTRGFSQLEEEVQHSAVAEFCRASLRKEDWFYSLDGGKYFAAENETGGYTVMLAEEY